jgi:DNA repair exonuclease SbcCD ATPase subunit
MQLQQIRDQVQNKVAQRDLIQSQLTNLLTQKKNLKRDYVRKERALEFVKDIALKTQSQLEFHLSDMVSTGLNSVFDQEYNFRVIFEIKRGKTECNLYFEKDGNLADPLTQSGLGAADVAAFCLRCAGYSMNPIYRNTLVMDEPFKHLSINYHEKVGALVKMLSEKLNLQIIMVTHSEIMSTYSDKVFEVSMTKGVSKIKELKGE